MTYQQFIDALEEEMKGSVGAEIQICVQEALKNNGIRRKGFLMQESGRSVNPTIYLEEYYQQYQTGARLEDITEQIKALYREIQAKPLTGMAANPEALYDYGQIQGRIMFKIINREKNEAFLKTVPYISYLDMAIVFYVLLDVEEAGAVTMMVTREHSRIWGKEDVELMMQAKKNAARLLPPELRTMQSVISEILTGRQEEAAEDFMYVLSNQLRCLGAACILYDGVMEMIGDRIGENYFVIPSSIHEVIIIPESASPEYQGLNEMIREINATQVADEEILGEAAYYYERHQSRLYQMPELTGEKFDRFHLYK